MPPAVVEKGILELLDKGLLGLLVIVLACVIVILWRYSSGLQREIAALHEKHAEEAKAIALESAKVIGNVAAQSGVQASAMEGNNRLLQSILDVVRSTPSQHEALARMLDRNYEKMDSLSDRIRGALP